MTTAEAIAAGGTRAVPAAVQAVVDQLDAATRDQALLMWATASIIEPTHPMIAAVVSIQGMTAAEIAAFWVATVAA